MIKSIILICSVIAIIIGYFYYNSTGLIVSIHENGEIIYANSFQSMGGDDNLIISLSFMTFIFSFIISYYSYIKSLSYKNLKIIYSVNYILFIIFLLLVNLDISIINSIYLGDFLLLFGITIITVPFFFFINKKAT